jgi:hypothetical protein
MGQVQTRSEFGGLLWFDDLSDALSYADNDRTVWKISFNIEDRLGTRVRLVRHGDQWVLEQMDDAVRRVIAHMADDVGED